MPTTLLSDLADGAVAHVVRVVAASPEMDAVALRRLGELGFIGGEPVRLLRRGPGGREPIAVLIGETLFALRLLEARCVEVAPVSAPAATARMDDTSFAARASAEAAAELQGG